MSYDMFYDSHFITTSNGVLNHMGKVKEKTEETTQEEA